MLGNTFYHETIRRCVIGFGTIFNDIHITRKDSSGNLQQSMKVPLAYGPKQKFLVRLREDPSITKSVAITLPRIGFEIGALSYDPTRKLNKIQKVKKSGSNSSVVNTQYMPVPYNISYQLYCFTATAEGGLQIVEQILPYFQPDYTVTINVIPELGIKRDVPIILNSVNYEDSYSGDFESRRAVIYTLGFTAKTYLYGPASTQKVIKETQSDLHTDLPTSTREERIIVTPNPTSAAANDDFGFTTSITFFQDGKNYSVTTDEDV